MAQFDVHRNLGASRSTIPYVVILQSSQYDDYRRRVVAPLRIKKSLPADLFKSRARLNPVFTVEGQEVALHVLDMTSVDMEKVGAYVLSLNDEGMTIADALDELFTRTWG